MANYRVQLKQGSRTVVAHIEANSHTDVLALFEELSTMKVTEISKLVYENDTTPPTDDLAYHPIWKGIARNEESGVSKQVIIPHVKLSKNAKEVSEALRRYTKVKGLKVDSTIASLFKIGQGG